LEVFRLLNSYKIMVTSVTKHVIRHYYTHLSTT